jgi:hypothetical protein
VLLHWVSSASAHLVSPFSAYAAIDNNRCIRRRRAAIESLQCHRPLWGRLILQVGTEGISCENGADLSVRRTLCTWMAICCGELLWVSLSRDQPMQQCMLRVAEHLRSAMPPPLTVFTRKKENNINHMLQQGSKCVAQLARVANCHCHGPSQASPWSICLSSD